MVGADPNVPCLSCGTATLLERISFGELPVCNHYLASPEDPEKRFSRTLCQCASCGLIQLRERLPNSELRSPYDWIRYGEPEAHLDELTERTAQKTDLKERHLIYGLSYKDASLLERLRARTGCRGILLDIANDLHEPAKCAGVESVQALFDERLAREIASKYGRARIVVARHLFEHVQDLQRFARAVLALLEPGGYLILDQPDFSLPLTLPDYTTIWEERSAFYTPATLKSTMARLGFEISELLIHQYPLEHALVAIGKATGPLDAVCPPPDQASVLAELEKGKIYGEKYPAVRQKMRSFLGSFGQNGGSLAMFGAGHMATNFINLHGLQDLFSFVVDDHPKKCGLYMPGSRIPIVGSNSLIDANIWLCLLTVRPEIEQAIIQANSAFVAKGGTFLSILPGGPLSLNLRLQVK